MKRKSIGLIYYGFLKPMVKYPIQDVVMDISEPFVYIGTPIRSTNNRSIGIPLRNLFEHTLVIGSTGSGKTYTVSRIVKRLWEIKRDVKIVIIDWHGEYGDLLPEANVLSPFNY